METINITMETLVVLTRVFLFGVFAVAGISKLTDRPGSEKALRDFGVPDALVRTFVYLLPAVELLIAAGLLFSGIGWYAAIAAVVLLAIFTAGMAVQLAKGNTPDCHCFGQVHSEPVGKASIVRNAAFAALAALIVFAGPSVDRAGLPLVDERFVLSLLFVGMAMILLLIAVLALALLDRQTQVIRRLEMLEIIAGTGTLQEREDAGNPEDALPIGAPFPDFEIADAGGRKVRFEHLLSRGRPMLFFFLGPNCNPCRALYPEIEEWRAELADKLEIVLVSSGKAEENLEKFNGDLGRTMLLQTNRELAEQLHAKWTPTAIYVSAEGDIASHPAVGDSAIRELVDKIRREDLSREFVYFALGSNGRPNKIGKRIPDVVLNGLNGEQIKSSDLIGSKRLVVFWSLSCPHCLQMAPQIREYEANRQAHEPELIIFSDGDPDELRNAGIRSPIVIDPKYTTSMEFGMYGTPSAVLVDERGVIVTESGIGAPNIWSLIGRKFQAAQ